jgi:N,N'-diacetyllegionaminate synthase
MPCEAANRPLIRRSLVANCPLAKGANLSRAMIEVKRPSGGIEPKFVNDVLGRRLARDLREDEAIQWADLA